MTERTGLRFLIPWMLCIVLTGTNARGQFSPNHYISMMDSSLDTIIGNTAGQRQLPLLFSANLFYAHEAVIESVPLELLQAYVDAFREAGVHRVDFNPGTWPWLVGNNNSDVAATNRAKYDALVDYIRASGLLLNVNTIYTSTYNPFASFDAWKAAAIPIWAEIAERYKPDTLIIIHEPTTMNERLNLEVGPDEWASFVQDAARAIKAAAPRTRLGVGFLFYEFEYLEAMLPIPEIDVLTIDIYTLGRLGLFGSDFTHLEIYEEMVNMVQTAGKTVYLEETWRPAYRGSSSNGMSLDERAASSVGDGTFQETDEKWLTAMVQNAAAWGLEAVTPFWTQPFFYYAGPNESNGALDPGYNRNVAEAIAARSRTPTFAAFQELTAIHSAKNITVNSSSFVVGPAAVGSIASVFPLSGVSLADSSADATTLPLPTKLAGSEILITDRNGFQQLASLAHVRPNQINFIVPDRLAQGPATIDVRLDSGALHTGALQIAPTSPGIYAANQNGTGVGAAYVVRTRADGSQNVEYIYQPDSFTPNVQVARPVDLGPETDQVQLVLFGTGIRGGTSFSAQVGGENALITYAGDQWQYAGLDQVQMVLPRSLLGRGEVPVRLQIDNKVANSITVHIR